ncbi:MAG: response regulator [bacterium]
MTILIVDNDTVFLDTISQRLALRGVDVLCATSGREALEILEKEGVETVILDISMPEMSGLDTLKAIKADHPSLPVLMLTGHASRSTAQESIEMGAADYLCKPFPMDELLEKIQECGGQETLGT